MFYDGESKEVHQEYSTVLVGFLFGAFVTKAVLSEGRGRYWSVSFLSVFCFGDDWVERWFWRWFWRWSICWWCGRNRALVSRVLAIGRRGWRFRGWAQVLHSSNWWRFWNVVNGGGGGVGVWYVLSKLVFCFPRQQQWLGWFFFICICDFFCIVILYEGLGLQGPQG